MRRSRLENILLYFAPETVFTQNLGYYHVIAMSVLVLNLRKIQCAILRLLTYLLAIFMPVEKWAIVQ